MRVGARKLQYVEVGKVSSRFQGATNECNRFLFLDSGFGVVRDSESF